MTTMRCPLGHPPGPQQFCPICGRAMVPVPDEPAQPAVPTPNAPTQALLMPLNLKPPAPPQPPPEPLPPVARPPGPPVAGESAAAQAQRLIDELRAGRTEDPPAPAAAAPAAPAPVSSWTPRPDVAAEPTERSPGIFPSSEVPGSPARGVTDDVTDYVEEPTSEPSRPFGGDEAAPPGHAREQDEVDEVDEDATGHGRPRSRLLPLLLAAAVLLGGGYLIKTLAFSSSGSDVAPAVSAAPTHRAVAPRTASPAESASTGASRPNTYTAAEIAASMQDPHFKHGYTAGLARKKTGAASDAEQACRNLGLAERKSGYPWGAHDRQGCLIGLRS